MKLHQVTPAQITLFADAEAVARLEADAIASLTDAATRATFYRDGLTDEEIAANRRVVSVSGPCCEAAAGNAHQRFVAAFVDDRLAG